MLTFHLQYTPLLVVAKISNDPILSFLYCLSSARSLNVIEVIGSSGVNTAFKNEINSSGLFSFPKRLLQPLSLVSLNHLNLSSYFSSVYYSILTMSKHLSILQYA